MFASLRCMHYHWKNCFVAWQGQFNDKDKHNCMINCSTLITLDLVLSLWIPWKE
jgi:hypothetical protein